MFNTSLAGRSLSRPRGLWEWQSSPRRCCPPSCSTTGHWFIEYFLGYFAALAALCLGWRPPSWIASIGLAEFYSEPLPTSVRCRGSSGALAAALIAHAIILASNYDLKFGANGLPHVP